MKKFKIAVIGAGSTYTQELIQGFIEKKDSIDIDSIYIKFIILEKLPVEGAIIWALEKFNNTKDVFFNKVRNQF